RLSMLTSGAAEHVREQPALARDLVRRELLNPTAVEGAFSEELAAVCSDAPDSVRQALKLLLWEHRDIALRWLAGRSLSDRDVALTSLPRALSSEREALSAIAAIAGIAQRNGRPFVLLMDELEHFVNYDRTRGGTANVTWLKRLLEQLAARGAFVMVAGHSGAWSTGRDLLDRFSAGSQLMLTPLRADEVEAIADLFSGRGQALDGPTAEAVTCYSHGNMRSALALLRSLFEATDGFEQQIAPAEIGRLAAALTARVSPAAAITHFESLLRENGFVVRHELELAPGVRADLVAEYDGEPAIVVEHRHATYQARQHDQLQSFLERLTVARRARGAVAAFFLSEGSLDRRVELLLDEQHDLDVYAYDITRADFVQQARPAVEQLAAGARARSGVDDHDARHERRVAQAIDRVETLKQSDAGLYEDVRRQSAAAPLPEAAFTDIRDRPREVFELLTARLRWAKRGRIVFGSPIGVAQLFAGILGLALILLGHTLAHLSFPEELTSFETTKLSLWIIGGALMLAAMLAIGYRLYAIDSYYDFRDRILRDLLLRGAPPSALIDASAILENTLEQAGPRSRGIALHRLREVHLAR
ncbi:MAG TPA: hypothetical protein VNU28_02350, partial [Solirubrobacteraceae bacterium]|nr:hypothetical protein [Solirubrobacteraceae bacterium]